jgi:macrolide-specific efflux system membrane fusion protein
MRDMAARPAVRFRKKRLITGIIVLALLGTGGWYGRDHFGDRSQTEASLSFADVTIGNIESVVTAQGKLEPKDYIDVGAQVSGQIKKLHTDIGAQVKNGDLIAEIDPDVYEAKVSSGKARMKTLEAQKSQQEAEVKQAEQKLARNEKLFKTKAVSEEIFQDAQTAFDIAKAQLMSLEAQIEEAQSTLEGDETNLSYTKIYAPMDGTVVSHSTKEGQTINASQTAPVIVQIANLDIMTVRAQVAEADIGKLRPDMDVYFTTLGSQGRKWHGNIRQILPSPETVNDVVLYNVLVDVDNKDRQLMTGMTTQMFFVLGSAKDVMTIPASALIRRLPKADTDDGMAYEVQVMKGHQPEARTVIIGLADRMNAEVKSGLTQGDKVVVSTPAASTGDSNSSQGRMRGGRMPGMARL